MVLAAFVYYVNNKMTSVVEFTFVDESQNFDFEKSGTCSQHRRSGKWSWLYKAECDKSVQCRQSSTAWKPIVRKKRGAKFKNKFKKIIMGHGDGFSL